MVKALFDTNILIDYLNGIEQAKIELARFQHKAISVITWMEVMVGEEAHTEGITRGFLNDFEALPIDDNVSGRAVVLRRMHRLKLPDAIVWATAQIHGCILVSRNTKDFPVSDPGVRVPYTM